MSQLDINEGLQSVSPLFHAAFSRILCHYYASVCIKMQRELNAGNRTFHWCSGSTVREGAGSSEQLTPDVTSQASDMLSIININKQSVIMLGVICAAGLQHLNVKVVIISRLVGFRPQTASSETECKNH